MPLFSSFTPFGMFGFSSKPSHAEVFYDALLASYGGEDNFDPNGEQAARCYATAMVLANARYTLERAANQADPAHVLELLPTEEAQYGLVPGRYDTIAQRRTTLARKKAPSLGSRPGNIAAVLSEVLGDGFVAHRATPIADAVTTSLTTGVLYADPGTIGVLVQLVGSGLDSGERVFNYEQVAGEGTILVGQKILIQPEHNVRSEVVTVTAVGVNSFTATMVNPHDEGSLATTSPFYNVTSSKRRHQVLLTPEAIRDPEMLRKLHEEMRTLARGVSTWHTWEEISPRTAGPFTVEGGRIGRTPIGEVEF